MHRRLQFDGAFHGIDCTRELNQNTVSHEFHDPAAISGDKWLENFSTTALESGQRPGFVALHEAAVANHIGGQDSGKAALSAFFGHTESGLNRAEAQTVCRP